MLAALLLTNILALVAVSGSNASCCVLLESQNAMSFTCDAFERAAFFCCLNEG